MSLNTEKLSYYGDILGITKTKGDVVLAAAAKAGHRVTRVFGANNSAGSDHRFGQCIDFMHYGDTAQRNWVRGYLIDNADPLGVMGIISNGRCMGFPSEEGNPADREVVWNGPEGTWRDYHGDDQHTDHVHVQFNSDKIGGGLAGPIGAPAHGSSYKRPTSGEVYLDKLKPGTKNSDSVYYWQMALNAITLRGGSELTLDGDYDSAVTHETGLFQKQKCGDPVDGWPGQKQAAYGFGLAKQEMRQKGVTHLTIYRNSDAGGQLAKVW